ncbi:hypothetical protein E3N88_43503 [Mikania micrantha]|uniref:Uncharacterized protein n=1 Tax=Mikania micrantha TaxID=192012 RepID=A0A5N6LEW4_9ASTR|nr:hypothetical protein E3N88_43503 [Mikania micrantha]
MKQCFRTPPVSARATTFVVATCFVKMRSAEPGAALRNWVPRTSRGKKAPNAFKALDQVEGEAGRVVCGRIVACSRQLPQQSLPVALRRVEGEAGRVVCGRIVACSRQLPQQSLPVALRRVRAEGAIVGRAQ